MSLASCESTLTLANCLSINTLLAAGALVSFRTNEQMRKTSAVVIFMLRSSLLPDVTQAALQYETTSKNIYTMQNESSVVRCEMPAKMQGIEKDTVSIEYQ